MTTNVQFTPSAEREFYDAVTWIAQQNLLAAQAFIDRVEKAFGQISRFPLSGSHIPEYPNTDYRQVFARPYRLLYKPETTAIWVIAVKHFRQE